MHESIIYAIEAQDAIDKDANLIVQRAKMPTYFLDIYK